MGDSYSLFIPAHGGGLLLRGLWVERGMVPYPAGQYSGRVCCADRNHGYPETQGAEAQRALRTLNIIKATLEIFLLLFD